MDLAYLTGQRPADVLKMRLPDIRDGFLWLSQGKTHKKLRMAIAGELAALIERIQGRAYKVTSLALIRNETGQPLSYSASTPGLRKRANELPRRWTTPAREKP